MPSARGTSYLEKRLFTVAQKTLSYLSLKDSSVRIFLLSGAEMCELEKKAGMRRPGHVPNVLSFAEPKGFPHPETRRKLLGEVYVNKDLATYGFLELVYLLIHGILHLVGYSHEKKNDILNMEVLEREIYKKVLRNNNQRIF